MNKNTKLQNINQEIGYLTSELERVMNSLREVKHREKKYKHLRDEAMVFIEKSEKIISLAEQGKLSLSFDQKEKISKTLSNILTIYKK